MSSKNLSRNLLAWYDQTKRQMPWRDQSDPYRVWLSEIMLQQTQVTTVIGYYHRWLKRFPSIKDVASASIDEVLKYWEGLGYYSRARNFHQSCRQIINDGGEIPRESKAFEALKGVGPYIAAAVQSISFNIPVSVVDGNVNRVASRLNTYKKPPLQNKKVIQSFMDQILDQERPGDFNQAIMDLGRYICKPRNPLCDECPISGSCKAHKISAESLYPVKTTKKPRPHYDVAVGIIWDDQKLLITKRKEDGLLGGLWEFPGGKMKKKESALKAIKREIKEELSIQIKTKKIITKVDHNYSHFSVTINAIHCLYDGGAIKLNGPTDYKWIELPKLSLYAFPKASTKLFKSIEALT